jgi:hypothetical protein
MSKFQISHQKPFYNQPDLLHIAKFYEKSTGSVSIEMAEPIQKRLIFLNIFT